MNLQERIEALETEFVEKIKALKVEAQQKDEFPQDGNKYWFVLANGNVGWFYWDETIKGSLARDIGNVFRTKEQAEFAVEKLKVEGELRKFSRPFEEDEDNFFMVFDTDDRSIDIWSMSFSKMQGAIYFESKKVAQQVIQSVGEDRIKKYIFGVED